MRPALKGKQVVTESPDPKRPELLAEAERVAKECLEPRAEHYDRSASHPWESWHDLWEQGFLGMWVPEQYGGLGLDTLTYIMAIERLAHGCTSSAMTLHMHSVVLRFIDALCTPRQKARFYPDVVDGGKLFGSWGSEPKQQGPSASLDTVVEPSNGGFVINGRKHFCTMAGAAHRYMVHCTLSGHDGIDGYQLALVPHDTPGIRIEGDWDTLGMRATVSPAVSFHECSVDADALLGNPGEALYLGVSEAFGLGYAAVYVGAAQKALDIAIDLCKGQRSSRVDVAPSENPTIQRHIGAMTATLEGARLLLYQSASRWDDAPAEDRAALASRAKYLAAEAALMVTSKSLQTLGGRSAHRHLQLERLFRDVRTSTLMPPNIDRSLELAGRSALGLEATLLSYSDIR